MQSLINTLKNENQDFEFYPTTKQMVEVIYNDLAEKDRNDKYYSLLDIGCGNGNFFTKFKEIRETVKVHNLSVGLSEDEDYYNRDVDSETLQNNMRPKASISEKFGIEKSEILINNLPNDVVIVGTDFWENTLLDKKIDIIFSNPPYSEFEEWTVKIINESYCKSIYLVIPERWIDSKLIAAALKNRDFKATVLHTDNFLNAERAARATVNIVKINSEKQKDYYYNSERAYSDPFETWFNSEFKIDMASNDDLSDWDRKRSSAKNLNETVKSEVVKGRDLVQILASLYQEEMARLLESYKKISTLDGQLLKELGVSLDNIKKGLKEKIGGVKYKYWHELFDNLDKIKSRLTSSKRKVLLEKLHSQVSVDFTESNAYAIVIWVIKNANLYFDEQLKEMYIRLTEPSYIKNYKSNQKTWQKDGWRYTKDHTHYTLEYRIVTQDYRGYRNESDLINDIRTIANNLGFSDIGDVKTFKNNNVHFKFEKEFMKAFNIEAARLFGWVKDASDVVNEFEDVTLEEANSFFKSNFLITGQPYQLLLSN